MTFSIMFWNIWYLNQIEEDVRLYNLQDEIQRLTDKYQPDFVALNEVVKPAKLKTPKVIDHLQKLGYEHHHYGEMLDLPGCWTASASLSSRIKISDKKIHIISKQAYAANRGYEGIQREVITARAAPAEGLDLRIIVAHPHATIDSIPEHKAGMKSLNELIRSEPYAENTILLGDMNEWRFMPGSFRSKVKDVMHSKTGSILHPTWRYDAHKLTPLRLNLDYIYWSKQSDFTLKDFKVLPSHASDHSPILAVFET